MNSVTDIIVEDVNVHEEKKCDCKCHKEPSSGRKWYFTLISVIIFVVVVNPLTYKLVNNTIGKLFGLRIASRNGCPTMTGLLVHTIVFTLIVRYVMDITK